MENAELALAACMVLAGGVRLAWLLWRAAVACRAAREQAGVFSGPRTAVDLLEWTVAVPLFWLTVLLLPLVGRLGPGRRLFTVPRWPLAPRMRGPRPRRLREFREPSPWTRGPMSF
ncbi:MAG TPA: hypothetical protein VFU47_10480 [Armatimonadota bacterium]|nr:hypothetical protein [Armatimonadota bacterium]